MTSRGENLTRISAVAPAAISPDAGLTVKDTYAAASLSDVAWGPVSKLVKAAVTLACCVGDGDPSMNSGVPEAAVPVTWLLPPRYSESDGCEDEPTTIADEPPFLPGTKSMLALSAEETLPLAGVGGTADGGLVIVGGLITDGGLVSVCDGVILEDGLVTVWGGLAPDGRLPAVGGMTAAGPALMKSIAVCLSIISMCQSYSRLTTPVFCSDNLQTHTSRHCHTTQSGHSLFVHS